MSSGILIIPPFFLFVNEICRFVSVNIVYLYFRCFYSIKARPASPGICSVRPCRTRSSPARIAGSQLVQKTLAILSHSPSGRKAGHPPPSASPPWGVPLDKMRFLYNCSHGARRLAPGLGTALCSRPTARLPCPPLQGQDKCSAPLQRMPPHDAPRVPREQTQKATAPSVPLSLSCGRRPREADDQGDPFGDSCGEHLRSRPMQQSGNCCKWLLCQSTSAKA